MSSLVIIKPLPFVQSSAGLAATPDPKEALSVAVAANTSVAIDIDLGSAMSADSFFIGYHSLPATASWFVQALTGYGQAPVNSTPVAGLSTAPLGVGPPSHLFAKAATPFSSRYWRFSVNFPPGIAATTAYIGVIALGLAFQPTWGQEYGSGRYVGDTGSADRLFGGGFGINEGARYGAWSWTMGDLTDAEIRTLYQLVKDRGQTRSTLVVEDPDQTDGLNERIHWGLFQKLEAFERLAPGATKWAMTVEEWA